MSEAALTALVEFVTRYTGRVVAPSAFPSAPLLELAEARDLPAGSAGRVLAVLDIGIEPAKGDERDGADLRRRAIVAGAVGACFSDVETAAPTLIAWLADSGPSDPPASAGSGAERADRGEAYAAARQALAHACVESLERLLAPASPEYEAALETASEHADPDLRRDVEYARERLASEQLRRARERVALAMAEVVERLPVRAAALGAKKRGVVREAGKVLAWLVGVADQAGVEPPRAGSLADLEDGPLLEGIVEDLGQLAPDAFSAGPVDLASARALSQTLAAALAGDADAARTLETSARSLPT